MDNPLAASRGSAMLGQVPRRVMIPPQLNRLVFTVAAGLRAGLSRTVLDSERFWRPLPGVRASVSVPDDLNARTAAAMLVTARPFAFCLATGAGLLDLPLPERLSSDRSVHVLVRPGHAPRRQGLVGHTGSVPSAPRRIRNRPVVGPGELFLGLSQDLADVDTVALGDALLRRGVSATELTADVEQASGRRGVRRARRALALVRPGVDSPMETRVRLMLTGAGLPEPITAYDVVEGEWLARVDLAYPELRIAIEYEGDHHRSDARQWRKDIARVRALTDAGWYVLRLTAEDVYVYPERTIAQVRRLIAQRVTI